MKYNQQIRAHTVTLAILAHLQRPPTFFEAPAREHFRLMHVCHTSTGRNSDLRVRHART